MGAAVDLSGQIFDFNPLATDIFDFNPPPDHPPGWLDPRRIEIFASEWFYVPLHRIRSKDRTQHVAFVRQVMMYLERRLTPLSFPQIGERFGRDHSTVIHGYNLIASRVESDRPFARSINQLIDRMKTQI